ncbi:MAG: hypothetical protein V4541_14530 [Bacteroidota bacterium]
MKLIGLLYLSGIVALLSSCNVPSYFLPAAPGNDIAYLPKPMSSDTIRVKNYISASYANLELPYATGELNMGFLNFSRAHTTKNLNIAYGAFGFAGKTFHDSGYAKETSVNFNGKSFLGGGLRTAIGFYDVAGTADFRILSWENALSFENGSYADFRRSLKNQQNADTIVSKLTTIYTTGIASEIIFHARRKPSTQFAFRLFYGFSPGLKRSLANDLAKSQNKGAALDFSFFFKAKNFFGIYSAGGNKGFSSKISLGYAF